MFKKTSTLAAAILLSMSLQLSFIQTPSALAYSGTPLANVIPGLVLSANTTYNEDGSENITVVDETSDAYYTNSSSDVILYGLEDSEFIVGFSQPFDGIAIEMVSSMSGGTHSLQYWDGDSWANLSLSFLLSSDSVVNDEDTGVFSKTWDRPSDWATTSVYGYETLYYMRLKVDSAYDDTVNFATSVGVIDYNLKLELTDELGNALSGLTEEEFEINGSSGVDDTIYSFEEITEGVYGFALDAPTSAGAEYDVSIHPKGYVGRDNVYTSLDLDWDQYREVSEDYAYAQRMSAEDESGNALVITGAEVEGIDCSIDAGEAYCPLDFSDDTDANAIVYVEGYENAFVVTLTERSSATEAQNITVLDVSTDADTSGDSDGDLLSDAREGALGTDPNDSDSDNDGVRDGAEVYDGTDPLDETDYLASGDDYYTDCTDPFMDTAGHWAEKSICLLYDAGIVQGRTPDEYEPSAAITRAEFLKVALLNAGFTIEEDESVFYTDVLPEDWFYSYITYATAEGYIEGYDDGSFRPNENINRAEAVIMMLRIEGVNEADIDTASIDFSDVSSEDWFAWAVVEASEKGMVEGYDNGEFKPSKSISRAEVAVIARRASYIY